MLRHRIITALIATPIFILAILFLSPAWFSILAGLIVLGCAWEWACLAGIKSKVAQSIYVFLFFVLIGLTFISPTMFFSMLVSTIFFLYLALLLWVFILAVVISYAKEKFIFLLNNKPAKLVLGFFLLIPFWISFTMLQGYVSMGTQLLIAFTIIWSVDIGAYFIGRFLGRHKMIPRVSPNKTWEGFVGGVGAGVIISIVIGCIIGWAWEQVLVFAVLALVTALFAVLGDLFESMMKRQAGVKDSGNIFPGHGGFLDRFDSAIAALPIFLLGMILLSA